MRLRRRFQKAANGAGAWSLPGPAVCLFWVGMALLGAAVVSELVEPLDGLFRLIPRGYNEGWNAYWANVAWQGGRLYPPADSAIANNYRRERLAMWLLTAVTLIVVAMAWSWLLFGADFFIDLSAPRTYHVHTAVSGLRLVLRSSSFIFALSVTVLIPFVLRSGPTALKRSAALALLYMGLAFIIGTLAKGGSGVDKNSFFDLLIAACLAVGMGLESLRWYPTAAPRRTAPRTHCSSLSWRPRAASSSQRRPRTCGRCGGT